MPEEIALLIGFFFFRIAGPFINNRLKAFHQKHNPKHVEKFSWYFNGFDFMHKAVSIYCLILILLNWLGIISFV
jgi:hypothetical protein